MPQTLLSLVSLAVIVVVCLATAVVGGWRERVGALSFLAAVLVSIGVQRISNRWDPVIPLAVVDATLLVVLCAMAWRPRRGWLVWAVGLQGLTLAVDGLRAAAVDMDPATYLAAVNLSAYGLTAVIGYAGIAAWRRRRTA